MADKKRWVGAKSRLVNVVWLLVMTSLWSASLWYVMGHMAVEAVPLAQEFSSCEEIYNIKQEKDECNALVALYNSTDGKNWEKNHGWLATANYCDWHGVTCEVSSRVVVELNLQANRLNGMLPEEIGNLTKLRELILSSNSLYGPIPESIENLLELTILWLGYNNQLSGPIPEELGKLQKLERLDLGGNSFKESIPDELGELKNLTELSLPRNQLTGIIPPSIATLPELLVLSLQNNQLSGSLPNRQSFDVAYFPKLQRLRLADNNFSGRIPPALMQLKGLEILNLANNRLFGPIPNFGSDFNPNAIFLENNQLSGAIPPSLGRLTLGEPSDYDGAYPLNLSRNLLTSIPPELCNLNQPIDLSYNKLIVDVAIKDCIRTLESNQEWFKTQTVPPTNIEASNVASDSIRLIWSPIGYTTDGGQYEISGRVSPTGVYTTYITETLTTSSTVISNLIPDTPYEFRIRTHTDARDLWSEYSNPILAIPRPTYVIVRGAAGVPYFGTVVSVYRGNQQIAQAITSEDGRVDANDLFTNGDTLQPGDELVAMVEKYAYPSGKAEPNQWAYKVYNTSMAKQEDGSFHRHRIGSEGGEQVITITMSNTLVLFDLLVSVEWNTYRLADAKPEIPYETFLKQLQRGLASASAFLYDATDGQFAFGEIAIYDGGQHWEQADIQILASDQVRPSAVVGGIVNEPFTYTSSVGNTTDFYPGFLRMGRAWNRYSGRVGRLDEEDAYRTLIHEFAHYAFGLYDEYLPISITDTETKQPSCTGSKQDLASIMDWHYTASEFALRPKDGANNTLWSQENCIWTQQWLTHGESDWETIVGMYHDKSTPPRWYLYPPYDQPNPGPDVMPLDLPRITVTGAITVTSPEIVVLDVKDAKGQLLDSQQAQIYLFKTDKANNVARIIDQGSPDGFGRIDLLGLSEGDSLKAVTWDGTGFASQVYDSNTSQITLTKTTQSLLVDAVPITVEGSIGLAVRVRLTTPLTTPLSVQIFGIGGSISRTITLTKNVDAATFYSGVVKFGADQNAFREGHLWVRTTDENGKLIETVTTYAIGGSPGSHGHAYPPIDPASSDGLLRVSIPKGNLPANTDVIVLPTRGLPVTSTYVLVSTPFAIRASGGLTSMVPVTTESVLTTTELVSPTLTMFYNQSAARRAMQKDPALAQEELRSVQGNLRIYHLDESTDQWQCIGGQADVTGNFISAYIQDFGIYAIMADKEPGC